MQILLGLFGRFLLCCVWIGLDWIQFLDHQLDWTGLGSMNRGFELDWILATQSIPYSAFLDVQIIKMHVSGSE